MKHSTLVKRIEEKGFKIINSCDSNRFRVEGGKEVLQWFKQGESALCVKNPSDQTDSMTDCFCDYYHDTLKHAVASLG